MNVGSKSGRGKGTSGAVLITNGYILKIYCTTPFNCLLCLENTKFEFWKTFRRDHNPKIYPHPTYLLCRGYRLKRCDEIPIVVTKLSVLRNLCGTKKKHNGKNRLFFISGWKWATTKNKTMKNFNNVGVQPKFTNMLQFACHIIAVSNRRKTETFENKNLLIF